MISICINTKDRYKKLSDAIKSIVKNKFVNYEILVIDQSRNLRGYEYLLKKPIRYFHVLGGVGNAKNFAIKRTRGEIIAFTDDDCIVDNNWLENINNSFKSSDVSAVFGNTYPYEPRKNKGKTCPSTFISGANVIIERPCVHWENIGFGNNMAYRKSIFQKLGSFKTWLGPNTLGMAAEDAEFALRALSKGYKILRNPKMKIYHNHWLKPDKFAPLSWGYSCGEVACYLQFALQGYAFAKSVVIYNFSDSYANLKKSIRSLLIFEKDGSKHFSQSITHLFFRLRGLATGLFFYFFEN